MFLKALVFVAISFSLSAKVFASNETCTNFSGFWEGQCASNVTKDVDQSYLAIEQDSSCQSLHWGPHPIVFGTETTTKWADGRVSRTEKIDWLNSSNKVALGGKTIVSHPDGTVIDAKVTLTRQNHRRMTMEFVGKVQKAGQEMPFQQTCRYKLVKKIKVQK